MLPFGESFASILIAYVVPALIGLLIAAGAARLAGPRYLSAFALGIYFWFFSDTIGGSSYLDVNSGFAGGLTQLSLVVLFILGLATFVSVDKEAFEPAPTDLGTNLSVPILVAVAVGIHGFGEGAAFSATAAATSSTNLLDAFGGVTAAVAFVLHKGIEPIMVGAAYWVYASARARAGGAFLRDMLTLTAAFVVPGAIGAATNYFLTYDTTYFFALGTGTSIYAALRLARPLFSGTPAPNSDSFRVALAMTFGFLCIYFAALFHS